MRPSARSDESVERGAELEAAWRRRVDAYGVAHPEHGRPSLPARSRANCPTAGRRTSRPSRRRTARWRRATPGGRHQRAGGRRDEPGRRVGGPRSVDAHRDERVRRLREPAGRAVRQRAADTGHGRRRLGLRGTKHPLRPPRARDGRGLDRDGAPWRAAPLRRDVPLVLRLHAAQHPPGGVEQGARDLRLDP